jgi:hypothetical protein
MAPNIMLVGYDAVVLARQRQTDEWFDVAPEMTIGGDKWRQYPIYAFGRFRSEPSQER